ncbi:hypothetical protein ARMGADRAFT_227803 [Armillaria gallica]|uniref:Uncharacterized protein n=1 Tax=Armillaria gallica TaxID=47427 RepID=A0A2H3E2U8_ARMGA|nr:hypothetical protein ARMGADRAFT_227803 [Armillaria gallica]
MTLMNSTYRRPRTKRPQPFEYDGILLQAGMLKSFGVQEGEYVELPMAIAMGSYDAPRVHLCKMGSWDTNGAYVSCGRAPLRKEVVRATTTLCRRLFGIPLGISHRLLLDRRGRYIRVKLMPLHHTHHTTPHTTHHIYYPACCTDNVNTATS